MSGRSETELRNAPLSEEPGNIREYTVSEVAAGLKRVIEDSFGQVRVRGELTGVRRAASGHLYLALKDEHAVLDAVLWRSSARGLAFEPEDGLEVVCTGRLTTYAPRSRYQLIVERMEPAGAGALMALLEERRRKLAAEGLFDAERKKAIPFLPSVIGVVTSPTGAVIRDILHRLADRFPRPVLLWPVLVQGEGAAAEIAHAIEGFNRIPERGAIPRPDVLIIARGGGSLEDLWAFNEEIVVRAAAASVIPLISAVGHETDTTLIDHAADLRAPTPTAAAELAVPVRSELVYQMADLERRMLGGLNRLLRERRDRLGGLVRGLRGPRELLAQAVQRLDELAERLPRGLGGLLRHEGRRLAGAGGRLKPVLLRRKAQEDRRALGDLARRFGVSYAALARDRGRRLEALTKLLASLGYESVLARGYAVVRAEGRPLTTRAAALPGLGIDIEFRDGHVPARVEGGGESPRRRHKNQDGDPPDTQGSLL